MNDLHHPNVFFISFSIVFIFWSLFSKLETQKRKKGEYKWDDCMCKNVKNSFIHLKWRVKSIKESHEKQWKNQFFFMLMSIWNSMILSLQFKQINLPQIEYLTIREISFRHFLPSSGMFFFLLCISWIKITFPFFVRTVKRTLEITMCWHLNKKPIKNVFFSLSWMA